jgi:hypothetical protein
MKDAGAQSDIKYGAQTLELPDLHEQPRCMLIHCQVGDGILKALKS